MGYGQIPRSLVDTASGKRRLLCLEDAPDARQFVEFALPGVHEAARPWVDWLLGNQSAAYPVLREWMHRPSSEVWVRRATLLFVDGSPTGGFISLSGAELSRCRQADAMATMKLVGTDGKVVIASRLKEARLLFPPVGPDEMYLSRIWVVPEARGAGHGTALLSGYLAAGAESEVAGFRLDVWSGNRSALRLYHSFGFETLAESVSHRAAMSYTAMVRSGARTTTGTD